MTRDVFPNDLVAAPTTLCADQLLFRCVVLDDTLPHVSQQSQESQDSHHSTVTVSPPYPLT